MWNKHLEARTRHYSSGVLSIVDTNGYPLSVRCTVRLNETDHVFTFPTSPPRAAHWQGKACLLFHQHNERLEGLKQLVILGELVQEEGLLTFQVSKFVTMMMSRKRTSFCCFLNRKKPRCARKHETT